MDHMTLLIIVTSIFCSIVASAREYDVSAGFKGDSDGSAGKPFCVISSAARITRTSKLKAT